MRRIDVGVQEADRHASMSCCCRRRPDVPAPPHPGQQHRAIGGEAFRHLQPQVARDQRLRPLHVEIVLLEAVLVGDLQRIAEPGGGDQRAPRALAFDQRIGGSVVPWITRSSDDAAIPASRRIACVPAITASSGAMRRQQLAGRPTRSGSASTRSVKVPPISTASRAQCMTYRCCGQLWRRDRGRNRRPSSFANDRTLVARHLSSPAITDAMVGPSPCGVPSTYMLTINR